MRRGVGLAVALGIVMGTLSIAQPVAAFEECDPTETDLGPVVVRVLGDCTVALDLVVLDDVKCPFGRDDRAVNLGRVAVLYAACTVGEVTPECPPTRGNGPLYGTRVELNQDCTVDVVLFPDIICLGPSTVTIRERVGPVYVEAHSCAPPGGLPIDPAQVIS